MKFTIEMGPNPKQPGTAEKVARNVLGGRPWVAIGDGAFRYAYNRVADDPDWALGCSSSFQAHSS